jgi:hypothetical protein
MTSVTGELLTATWRRVLEGIVQQVHYGRHEQLRICVNRQRWIDKRDVGKRFGQAKSSEAEATSPEGVVPVWRANVVYRTFRALTAQTFHPIRQRNPDALLCI